MYHKEKLPEDTLQFCFIFTILQIGETGTDLHRNTLSNDNNVHFRVRHE